MHAGKGVCVKRTPWWRNAAKKNRTMPQTSCRRFIGDGRGKRLPLSRAGERERPGGQSMHTGKIQEGRNPTHQWLKAGWGMGELLVLECGRFLVN